MGDSGQSISDHLFNSSGQTEIVGFGTETALKRVSCLASLAEGSGEQRRRPRGERHDCDTEYLPTRLARVMKVCKVGWSSRKRPVSSTA